jgi:hypothetical protein
MFEAERTAIGLKLMTAGSILEDAAEDHSLRFDPNKHTTAGAAETAGRLMQSLGERIMPGMPEDNDDC